jgi:ribosomal protein S18 acetylase RimI-like enzyme
MAYKEEELLDLIGNVATEEGVNPALVASALNLRGFESLSPVGMEANLPDLEPLVREESKRMRNVLTERQDDPVGALSDFVPGVMTGEDILGGNYAEYLNRYGIQTQPDPPSQSAPVPVPMDEPRERMIRLPGGQRLRVPGGMSEEDALLSARERYPFAFPAETTESVEPVEAPDPGPIDLAVANLIQSVKGTPRGFQALYQSAMGDEEGLRQTGEALTRITKERAEAGEGERTLEDIKKAYEDDGALGGASVLAEFMGEQAMGSLGFMAPSLAAAKGGAYIGTALGGPLGAAAGGTIGGLVGFFGSQIGNYVGMNAARAAENGNLTPEEFGALKNVSIAGGQTAFDALSLLVAGGGALARAGFTGGGKKVLADSFKQITDRIDNLSVGGRLVAPLIEEPVAEVAQQALERYSAGLDVSPLQEDALKEYGYTYLSSLVGASPVYSAVGASTKYYSDRKSLQKDIEKEGTRRKVANARKRHSQELAEIAEQKRAEDLEAQAEVDAAERAAVDEINLGLEGRALEEREQFVFDVDQGQNVVPRDIHSLAEDRNINSEDAGFLAFSKRHTGKEHLDDMDQSDLRKIYGIVSSVPVQDAKTSLPIARLSDVMSLAEKLKGKRDAVSLEKDKTIYEALDSIGVFDWKKVPDARAKKVANEYRKAFLRLGLARKNKDGVIQLVRKSVPSVDTNLTGEQYDSVVEFSRENERFPNRKEFFELTGYRNENVYDDAREEGVSRGDIKEVGDKYVPVRPDEYREEYGLRIGEEPTGERIRGRRVAIDRQRSLARDVANQLSLPVRESYSRFDASAQKIPKGLRDLIDQSTIEELSEVEESDLFQGINSEDSGNAIDYIKSKLEYEKERRQSERDGTLPDPLGLESGLENLSDKEVFDLLEVYKVRKPTAPAIESFDYNIEESEEWVVRRSDGEVAGTYDKRQDAINKRNQIQRTSFVREEDGEIKGYYTSKDQAERDADRFGGTVSPKKLSPVRKEKIFKVQETRSILEGVDRPPAPETRATFPTAEEAQSEINRLQDFRKGREVDFSGGIDAQLGGRFGGVEGIAERLFVTPSQATELLRSDPGSVADALVPIPRIDLAPREVAEADVSETPGSQRVRGALSEVLSGMGPFGDRYKINLDSSLDPSNEVAFFNDISETISIAMDPALEELDDASLREEIAKRINHELVHGFRRQGLWTPGEYKFLSSIARRLKPKEGKGENYLDQSRILNREQGDLENWIEDSYMEEAVAYMVQDLGTNPELILGRPASLLGRVYKVIDRTRNGLRGLGFQSDTQVFESLFGETVQQRIANNEIKDSWYLNRSDEKVGKDLLSWAENQIGRERQAEGRKSVPRMSPRELAREAYENSENGWDTDFSPGRWVDSEFIPVPSGSNRSWFNANILVPDGLEPDRNVLEEAIPKGRHSKLYANRDLQPGDSSLFPGDVVQVRIDVNGFKKTGSYAQTIHGQEGRGARLMDQDKINSQEGGAGRPGKVIGYDGRVRLEGPVSFGYNKNLADNIFYEGQTKTPLATVEGKIQFLDPGQSYEIPSDINEWTPVGYNPHKAVYFYDKETGREVIGGDGAFHIGNTVFTKNPVYGTRNAKDALTEGLSKTVEFADAASAPGDPEPRETGVTDNTSQFFGKRRGEPVRFTFARNTERSPDMGSRFGQDIEPAGRYLIETSGPVRTPGWESGEVTFRNPLYISSGEGYGSSSNWKQVLSKRYDGSTGAELSRKIAADGYDGIVTTRGEGSPTARMVGETGEIVDLTSFPAPRATRSGRRSSPRSVKLANSEALRIIEAYNWDHRPFMGALSRALKSVDSNSYTGNARFGSVKPRIIEVAAYFQDRANRVVDYKNENARGNKYLEDRIFDETLYALENNPSAVGWYDENLSLAMAILEELDPSIKDPGNRFVLNALLAITSNGQGVNSQFKQAVRTYEHFRDKGKFTGKFAFGKEVSTIRGHIKLLGNMIEDLGSLEAAAEWLSSTGTVGDVRESAKKWGYKKASSIGSGELVTSVVPYSVIFGPKLGSFFNNLYGDYSSVTMDRWFMRTIGRLTGTQLKFEPEKIAQAREDVRNLANILPTEVLDKMGIGDYSLAKSPLVYLAKHDWAAKKARTWFGKKDKSTGIPNYKTEKGSDLDNFRLAVNRLDKALNPLVEFPEGGSHRKWIRDRIENVQKRLKNQGIEIENADLQALLWYNEKNLYKALNVRERKGSDDYAAAAAELYEERTGRPSGVYATGTGRVERVGGRARDSRDGRSSRRRGDRPASEAVGEFRRELRKSFSDARGENQGGIPRPYRRGYRLSPEDLRRLGLPPTVRALGYEVGSQKLKDILDSAEIPSPTILEIRGPGAAKFFLDQIEESKVQNKFGSSVFVYDESDYKDMRLFLAEDLNSGIALKGNDIVSAFSNADAPRKSVYPLMIKAIDVGGRKADAFDTVLPTIYADVGMEVVSRVPWNDEYAPGDWNYELYNQFNDGRPDVTYLVYNPDYYDKYRKGQGVSVADPDEAESVQGNLIGDTVNPWVSKSQGEKISLASEIPYNETRRYLDEVEDIPQGFLAALAAEGAGRPVESVFDEYGNIDEAIDTAAYSLARDAGMGITRDRDLSSVVRDENGEVIGAQWRSFDGDNYEFDVVVAPEHRGSGVGRSLIDDGIAGLDEHLEFNPDATMKLSVTSDVSESALSRRGFEVVGGDNRIKVMERTSRATRRAGEGRFSLRRDRSQDEEHRPIDRSTPSLSPRNKNKSGKLEAKDFFWSWVKINPSGKYEKKGPGYPVMVKFGSLSTHGERHMERHDEEIRQNTPYSNSTEYLDGFLNALRSGPKNPFTGGGNIMPVYKPQDGKVVFYWDDPQFEYPGVVVMGYEPETRSFPSHWNVITTFVQDRLPEDALNGTAWTGPTRRDGVSTKAMMAFDKYRRPEVSEYLYDREMSKGSGRFSLNRSGVVFTPQQQEVFNAFDMGETTNKSLFSRMFSGINKYDNVDWKSEFRKSYIDQFQRVKEGESTPEATARRRGLNIPDIAAVSAYAMSSLLGRANTIAAGAVESGTPVFHSLLESGVAGADDFDGTVYVEEKRNLSNENPSVLIYDKEDGKFKRVSKSAPGLYLEEAKGGFWGIVSPVSSPMNNLYKPLFTYARALRAYNKIQQGFSVPKKMTMDKIKEGLALADQFPEVAVAHGNLQEWNKGIVKFAVDTGVLAADEASVWLENADYIPFYLDLEGEMVEDLKELFRRKLNREFDFKIVESLLPRQPSKKYKGMREGELTEPVESIIANANAIIASGIANLASRRAIRDGIENGWVKPKVAEDSSLRTVTVKDKGKSLNYVVEDPMLYDTLVGYFDGSSPMDDAIQKLSKPARLLREAVTRMPDFILANSTRDSINTWILHGIGRTPFHTMLESYKRIAKEVLLQGIPRKVLTGERTDAMGATHSKLRATGVIGGVELQDVSPEMIKRNFATDRGGKDPISIVKRAWQALGETSNIAEGAAREQVFEAVFNDKMEELTSLGMDPKEAEKHAMGEAGFQAWSVLNFGQRGSSPGLKAIASTVPFINSRIAGMDVFARNAMGENALRKDPNIAKRALLARAGLVASGTFIMALLQSEFDEDFENEDLRRRMDNWLIPFPFLGSLKSGYLALAIPFEAGIFTKVIPEALARAFMGAERSELVTAVTHSLTQTLQLNPVPQAAKPVLEYWLGKNFYSGMDLRPRNLSSLPIDQQSRASTSAIAKLGARLEPFDVVNPIEIDNFMRGYLGSAATYINAMADEVLHRPLFGLSTKPSVPVLKRPGVRRFITPKGEGRQNINTMYDLLDEVQTFTAAIGRLQEQGGTAAAKFAQEEGPRILPIKNAVNSWYNQQKKLSKHKRIIIESNMPRAEKRARIDEIEAIERRLSSVAPYLSGKVNADWWPGE